MLLLLLLMIGLQKVGADEALAAADYGTSVQRRGVVRRRRHDAAKASNGRHASVSGLVAAFTVATTQAMRFRAKGKNLETQFKLLAVPTIPAPDPGLDVFTRRTWTWFPF